MIDTAISHIATSVNRHLMRSFDRNEEIVVVSSIVEQDGSAATHVNDRIVVSLVNIEKESVPVNPPRAAVASAQRSTVSNPPIHFNLYLMFASYFSGKNYAEGLKFISSTISYLQGQNTFDHRNSPGLDRNIDKLVLDIHNLDVTDLSNLWGILSGNYLPSVLYKVRMVSIDAGLVKDQVPGITRPDPAMRH